MPIDENDFIGRAQGGLPRRKGRLQEGSPVLAGRYKGNGGGRDGAEKGVCAVVVDVRGGYIGD